ncbi:TIGR03745 family integrating conjugative element membrane protein [Pseudomonas lopnurensis]|uniref:TIGR03745 family integrating conjugative element membrane protein n=1 Tax=Pseudomonas lopnurensis TaxID=1477517 RepID=UPI0028AF7877|nr:TIGR03745 family integrating conjugative element membrane protein [Pseudomonas lopnurensis]
MKYLNRLFAGLVMLLPTIAAAALPEPETPSRGGGGGFLEWLQNTIYDGFVLGGLVLAAIVLTIVAMNAVQKFHEVTQKKATWTDFFVLVGVGAVLLMVVFWLVNRAVEVL